MTAGTPPPPGAMLTPQGTPGRRARRGWAEKTLQGITTTLESTVFAEEMAALPGLWQRVDARAKIIAVFALILAANLTHSLGMLVALNVFALFVAAAGRIPPGQFVRRVWLFLPFFTAVIALPAIFNVVTPGEPVVVLSSQPYIAITEQGVRAAATLILRVGASVSFAVILVLTTRWGVLLSALRGLRVPQVFVLILGMTYRYIFLLLHTTNDMFLARKSRQVGRAPSSAERAWLAGSMGTLLGKSYHLSDQVYMAMVSRGFRGEAKTMEPLRLQALDVAVIAGALLVPIFVVFAGRFL